jgi:hypothetical protein
MKRNLTLLIALWLYSTLLSAQISPGDLSNVHSHLEGVSNCTKCHSAGNKITNENCLACHSEIRVNQTAHKGFHGSTEVLGKNCSTCHNEHHGRTFRIINFNKKAFDHRKTGFELKGAHARQDCNACHRAEHLTYPKLQKKSVTYLGLNQNCKTCHDDFHQGKMSANCSKCHSFETFKNPKPFDHNKTHFPLLGKHKGLACTSCHKTETINGKKSQGFSNLKYANCNACHKDPHENRFGQNCKKCHVESSFHTVKNTTEFDHDQTDFKLLGKHRQVACKACHVSGDMTKPLKHENCSDCHKDVVHKGEFAVKGKSPDCDECHTNDGFLPSTYSMERHQTNAFPLNGSHQAVACTECHKKEGDWHFRNIGKTCVDCHKDVHKGAISDTFYAPNRCLECHSVTRWNNVTFDHSRTHFKLEGRHATVGCARCHYKRDAQGKTVQQFAGLSTECNSCHRDHHAGQFVVQGKTDCSRCHKSTNWHDTTFDHNNARFKLDGAHKNVACNQCHKTVNNEKGRYVEYKFDSIDCAKCHHG